MYAVEHAGAAAARALGWCAEACCDAWAVYAATCAADYAGAQAVAVFCNRTAATDYVTVALHRGADSFFGEKVFLG